MIRAALIRLLTFVATLFGATAFVLALLVTAPGDPIDVLPNGAELRPQLEEAWGLDQPLVVRYGRYLQRVGQLDLGTSLTYRPGQPVLEVIAGPAGGTLARLLGALVVVTVAGLALALATSGPESQRSGRLGGRWGVQAVSLVPVFLLAHALVLGFNETAWALMEAGRITRPDWFALPDQPSSLRTTLAITILAVGSGALAEAHAQIEAALQRIRDSPYVDAARARGEPVWPYVARNLVPPLAATVAERAAYLAGGVVIVEKVLLLNGVGAVLWQAALLRDYDLALAIALLAAAAVGLVRLAADGVRLAVDPRLRVPA